MSITNTNPETGIRYGIISAHALNSDVIQEIQSRGTHIQYETAKREFESNIRDACADHLGYRQTQEVVELALDLFEYEGCEEPIHEFEYEGVRGRTTWLGGALMVWVFQSQHTTKARLCSPCVPNCGDLGNLDPEDGVECYDVPPDWRVDHG